MAEGEANWPRPRFSGATCRRVHPNAGGFVFSPICHTRPGQGRARAPTADYGHVLFLVTSRDAVVIEMASIGSDQHTRIDDRCHSDLNHWAALQSGPRQRPHIRHHLPLYCGLVAVFCQYP
jgi:hypothetical protein